jgi:UDP-N-acetyl-D-mannosaminuronate dehydrogenase
LKFKKFHFVLAKKLKFDTKIVLDARKTNNFMEEFILKKIISDIKKIKNYKKSKIVVLGLTYKPDVPDYSKY